MKTTEEPIVVEETFNCSLAALWNAVTDRDQMVQWFFTDIPAFSPEVGFYTEFMVDAGERQFLHQWEITDSIPGEKVAYRWRYAGYAGAAQSVFQLGGVDGAACLRIDFPVEEDFPEEVPEFTREACEGGWTYFMGQLKNFVEDQA
ncbi:MAG: SRPBCC domain-containing protein [Gammaproteobacteria bacterium]